MKLVTAALGGKGGGDMKGLADHLLVVPSDTTARIQEMHIALAKCSAARWKSSWGWRNPAKRTPIDAMARSAGYFFALSRLENKVPHAENALTQTSRPISFGAREKTTNGRQNPACTGG